MANHRTERLLEDSIRSILVAEEDLRVLSEQLSTWTEMRDESKIRALVSETPQASVEHAELERQVATITKAIAARSEDLTALRRNQEQILERWEPEVTL